LAKRLHGDRGSRNEPAAPRQAQFCTGMRRGNLRGCADEQTRRLWPQYLNQDPFLAGTGAALASVFFDFLYMMWAEKLSFRLSFRLADHTGVIAI
jgi:hypothetical protein